MDFTKKNKKFGVSCVYYVFVFTCFKFLCIPALPHARVINHPGILPTQLRQVICT